MDESEREIWCRAWRLVQHHGSEAPRHAAEEVNRALHNGDGTVLAEWRKVADAVEELLH